MLGRARCSHRVRLAGARLAVGKDGDIISLGKSVDALFEIIPYACLVNVGPEHAIKDEQLAALG